MLSVSTILFYEALPRERACFSFSKEKLEDALVSIKRSTQCGAAVLLLTCDRLELWLENGRCDGYEPLCRSLSLSPLYWKRFSATKSGRECVPYLFELACGLHSPLFGEDTIISQLQKASELSLHSGCSSASLQQLFRLAVTAAKNVQARIDVDQTEPTLCQAVEKSIKEHDLEGKPILVIGSSAKARMLVQYFLDRGGEVTMTLRDLRKTELVIPGVRIVSFDERYKLLPSFPVIISATKGLGLSLEAKDAVTGDVTLLFDLACPHDIDDGLESRPGCSLVREDELVFERTNRQRNIEQSNLLLKKRIDQYWAWQERWKESGDIALLAQNAAQDVVYRLHDPLRKLHLDNDEEQQFRTALADSTYKSVLHQLYCKSGECHYLDLSRPLVDCKALYEGDPDIRLVQLGSLEKEGYRETRITMGSHSLTHVDAPSHILPEGKTLEKIPLSSFFGRAYVMDCSNLQEIDDVSFVPQGVDMLLFFSGWEDKFPTDSYMSGYPVLTSRAVNELLKRGIKLFGFDTPSADAFSSLAIHRQILAADALIVENMINLKILVETQFDLTVLPLNILFGDGSPVRAIATF
ncbi:MAG: cyclase family protein [Sphaerochaetaceae bacterium]